jgi:regulator of sigma E protease
MYGVNQLRPVIQSINPTPLVHNLNQLPLNSTIKTINNQAITSWQEAEQIVKQIKLPQTNLIITTTAQQKYTFNLNEYLLNRDHLSLTDLGIYPFRFLSQIAYIEPQSPASQAGLQEQDQIIAINQQSLNSWFNIAQIIRQHPSDKLNFTIKRGQQVLNLPVTIASSTDENGQIIGKIGIMPTLDTHLLAQNSFIQYYTWTSSFIYAYDACLNLIINNLQMIYSLINGQISWHNVGGPVTIAKASGLALHQGIKSFIDLLALISLSLAVMNLLPIPILDGGHIVLYSIEILRGKPLEAKTQHLILTIGLMMVLAITGIALYNDFLKLLNL